MRLIPVKVLSIVVCLVIEIWAIWAAGGGGGGGIRALFVESIGTLRRKRPIVVMAVVMMMMVVVWLLAVVGMVSVLLSVVSIGRGLRTVG